MKKEIKTTMEILCEVSGLPPETVKERFTWCIEAMEQYHAQFKLQKPSKIKLELPQDKIQEFNQLWPEFKLPTGKYGRCSMLELNSAFQFFFKTFPEYTDWSIILEAADIYLLEREQDKWAYTRRAKYFIRREASDKSWESELSEYYQRIRDGVQEIPRESGFDIKIL